MKFINTLREGERLSGIYLCKHKQANLLTHSGRENAFQEFIYVNINRQQSPKTESPMRM